MNIQTAQLLFVIQQEFVVDFEHRSAVFAVITTAFLTAIGVSREWHFFSTQQVIRGCRGSYHQVDIFGNIPIKTGISIQIILVVTS
jgi:hypothetical protein